MNARREHIATIATLCAVVTVAAFLAGFVAAAQVNDASGPTTAVCERADGGFTCVEVGGGVTWTPDPYGDCTEDMPCWDCTTMGNGRCGPRATLPGGEPASP